MTTTKTKRVAQYQCQECGKKYVAPRYECSQCGGSDIDLAPLPSMATGPGTPWRKF